MLICNRTSRDEEAPMGAWKGPRTFGILTLYLLCHRNTMETEG